MMEVLKILFFLLVFPGVLFCCSAGLLLNGIDRKMVARMQKRIGPPILQPFYDFFKLLGKETIVPHHASRTAFIASPYVGFASLVILVLFLPIFGYSAFYDILPFGFDTGTGAGIADMVVILYLLTIPALALMIGGAASGSPYAGVGMSREMVSVMAYELPLIIVFLTVAKAVSVDGGLSFSMLDIAAYQTAYGNLIMDWTMIPAVIAMLLIIPAELGSHPFDVAEAETEICDGLLVEYSGRPLAMFKLSYAVKNFVLAGLFVCLFIGGSCTGIVAVDALIFVLTCIAVTIVSISFVRAITARLKVEQVFKFYWTVVTVLALTSLVLVWVGL